jgi:GntR family transcriptional regulator, transcriptional repressor for pyruvate dehydrogenase complex
MSLQAASELVFEYLTRYIKRNSLVAGDMLPGELDLVEQVGVSRSSVREALITLKTLGIIQSKRKGGIKICRDLKLVELREYFADSYHNPDLYKDALGFRGILESGMAELIFEKISAQSIKKMKEIIASVKQQIGGKVFLDDADRDFHIELTSNCKNKLAVILTHLYTPVFEYSKSLHPDGYHINLVSKWIRDHEDMISAVENQNQTEFVDLLRKHTLLNYRKKCQI